ncbi:MAG: hypothetical protein KKF74_00510 [Nanoarchaeota archaeon]|nr:hypothetical protein [Nanoarchaeota archaeon]
MEKDSLTSKVNKIFNLNHPYRLKKTLKYGNFNYSKRKEIESKDVEEGIKFSLKFNSFILWTFFPREYYRFPEGHVAVIYKQGSDSLSTPFVEEKYSHPLLMEFNQENQPIDLGYFDEKIKNLPINERIVGMLEGSVKLLTTYEKNLSPCYSLNMPYFKKYRINPAKL